MTDTITKGKYMNSIVAAKEGICVKKFVIKLRCGSQRANTDDILYDNCIDVI